MKTAKWNYTEDINYKVSLVKLQAVPETPMHWQNALVGMERQVVVITARNGANTFLIDNQDGSGLLKIARGGGPDSYSAHVEKYEFIRDLPETEWQCFDQGLFEENRLDCDRWLQEYFPAMFERMKGLKQMIGSSPAFRGKSVK